jgi:hypothetical protein
MACFSTWDIGGCGCGCGALPCNFLQTNLLLDYTAHANTRVNQTLTYSACTWTLACSPLTGLTSFTFTIIVSGGVTTITYSYWPFNISCSGGATNIYKWASDGSGIGLILGAVSCPPTAGWSVNFTNGSDTFRIHL